MQSSFKARKSLSHPKITDKTTFGSQPWCGHTRIYVSLNFLLSSLLNNAQSLMSKVSEILVLVLTQHLALAALIMACPERGCTKFSMH